MISYGDNTAIFWLKFSKKLRIFFTKNFFLWVIIFIYLFKLIIKIILKYTLPHPKKICQHLTLILIKVIWIFIFYKVHLKFFKKIWWFSIHNVFLKFHKFRNWFHSFKHSSVFWLIYCFKIISFYSIKRTNLCFL